MTLIVAGTMTMNPEKADVATAAMTAAMTETRKESGNLAYTFSRDLSDPGIFHIYEKWESQAALDEHLATPHMATFMESMGGFDVSEAKVLKYEISAESDLF